MTIETVWAPVVAGFVASIATFLGVLYRDRRIGGKHREEERLVAYENVLARSLLISNLALTLRLTMKFRSGIGEGIDVALRHRKPIDPIDISDRIWTAIDPLLAAQSAVWAKGSRESIPLTNDLVDKCVRLFGIATDRGEGGTKFGSYVRGEQWTKEQDDAFLEGQRSVGEAQGAAELIRREGKREVVDLFERPATPTTTGSLDSP